MPRSLALLSLFLLLTWDASAQPAAQHSNDTICQVNSNGQKTGFWIIYAKDRSSLKGYPPDAKYEEGYYLKNRKTGYWIRYYPTGKKQTEITYKYGRPNGAYKKYYDNGQLEEVGVWSRNRYGDSFQRYYRSGCLEQEATFVDGIATERIFYQDNCAITDGKIRGSVLTQSVNGVRVKTDSSGRKQGYWKESERYDGVSITAEGEYVNGKKNGIWTGWYGRKRKCYEISFNMGVPDGWYSVYDQSGQKREQILRSDDGKSWVYSYYHRNNEAPIFTYPVNDLKTVADLPATYEWGLDVPDGFFRVADKQGRIVQVGIYEGHTLREGVHTPRDGLTNPCIIWYKDFKIVKQQGCKVPEDGPKPPELSPVSGTSTKGKIYNDNRQIWMDGQFVNGRLHTGKHYIYDKDGLLERIEIFKNGQYIGDGVIDQ